MEIPLAILCGGLGMRMRPQTLTVPKPLIRVNGEPFLGHLLRLVAHRGISDVVLLVGYRGEAIVQFAGDGRQYGLRLRYVFDGERPLGTAGAIRRALPLLGELFMVTYGDAYLPIDYGAVLEAFFRLTWVGLMTVYRWNPEGSTTPNTAIDGDRVTFYNKEIAFPQKNYVDYGLSVFHARAFEYLVFGEPADLGAVNRRLISSGDLGAFVTDEVPFEIGSPAGLQATESFLRGHA